MSAQETIAVDESADPRLDFMDALLASPHGKLAETGLLHQRVLAADPDFYGHLACWYHQHGVIRDQRLLFVCHLMLSADPAHRQAAFVMLQPLRTYEVARAVRYLKEVHHRLPRRMRSAVVHWLRRRELDPAWFDECALRDRKNLKYLYATLHIAADARAHQILFERRLPPDSRLVAVKQLARCSDPIVAARLIVEQRIFFSTAVGALRRIDAPVLAALIEVMTPQQLLNSLAALRKRGALDNPSVKQLIEQKLELGRTESRVQDARALRAAEACGDAAIGEQLGRIATARLRQRGCIARSTALFVDKSGSMEVALTVGAHLAALTSTIARDPLRVYAFDSVARRVAAPDMLDLVSWQRQFGRLRADGCTAIGAPFVNLQREQAGVEQVVVITDGAENRAPMFVDALHAYEQWSGRRCAVVVVLVQSGPPGRSALERNLQQAGVEHAAYHFDGDLYSLPNLIPYLCQPRRAELCAEILDQPLLEAADLQQLPPGFDPAGCEIL